MDGLEGKGTGKTTQYIDTINISCKFYHDKCCSLYKMNFSCKETIKHFLDYGLVDEAYHMFL